MPLLQICAFLITSAFPIITLSSKTSVQAKKRNFIFLLGRKRLSMKHTPNVSEVEDLLTKKLRGAEKLSLLGTKLLTL